MTKAQRRKINQENAARSTGPTTPGGKLNSRQNALKHGLTAKVLALPTEDAKELRDRRDDWVLACRPETPAEMALTDQAALSALRIRRLAEAEAAVVGEQVRHAQAHWDDRQDARLLDLTRALYQDPARAVLELRSFAAGTAWLLERWAALDNVLKSEGRWEEVDMVHEALRLAGHDPERLRFAPKEGYHLALIALTVRTGPEDESVRELARQRPAAHRAWWGPVAPDAARARVELRSEVGHTVEDLRQLYEKQRVLASADRAGAPARACVLEDTGRNRLFLRYVRSAESALERSLKLLARVQKERREAECEGAEAPARNEPNGAAEPRSSDESEKSYVASVGAIPGPGWVAPSAAAPVAPVGVWEVLPVAAGGTAPLPGV